MDRRKAKKTLHKHLTMSSNSQSSTASQDIFASSNQEKSQKRLSNTDLLRQQVNAIVPESESHSTQHSTQQSTSSFVSTRKRSSPVQPAVADELEEDSPLFTPSSGSSLENTPKKRQRLRSETPESPGRIIPPSQRQISQPIPSQDQPGTSYAAPNKTPPIPPSQKRLISTPKATQDNPNTIHATPNKAPPIPPSQKRLLSTPKATQDNLNTIYAVPKPPTNLSARARKPSKTNKIVGDKKLHSFLVESGVTLDENDDQFTIENDPFHIAKKMQKLLSNGDYSKEEIIQEWTQNVVQNKDSLEIALKSSIIRNCDRRQLGLSKSITLVQIFLHVPLLQTEILNGLLQKLNEEVIVSQSSQDLPWACPFINKLRFLGLIQDPISMTSKIEDLLETSPIWFQEYLIAFIPDIVVDAQHEVIAVILCRLIEDNDKLTKVILDCITNLSLGKVYRGELYEKMLTILENGCHISKIPPIVAFCLDYCSTNEVCMKVLRVIRELELQPIMEVNNKEYFANQMLIVNILKMKIPPIKEMANAALQLLQTADEAKPLDIIILIVLYNGNRKKKVENVLKQHAKSRFYNTKLLQEVYGNYRDVVKNLQPIALLMATNLLKSDDPMLIKFASNWIRAQFHALNDLELSMKQQEIIKKLMLIMGNNNETAKNALDILRRMTETDKEREYLQNHTNYLRSLIEKIVVFDLEEVTTLNNVLHALSMTEETGSNPLRDDLTMMMSKQLSSRETTVKCKGVVGAVMAIKYTAMSRHNPQKALDLFNRVQSDIKGYPRCQGLFYDKLGDVIPLTNDIDADFLNSVYEALYEELVNMFTCAKDEYGDDVEPIYNLDPEKSLTQPVNATAIINFTKAKSGAVLAALLRLLKICSDCLNKELGDINELLGSAMLMPTDMQTADAETLDIMFYCINWCRELINTFVAEPDPGMQKKVSKRLDNVMELQGQLSMLLLYAESRYQPPSCYFHRVPLPPLNKIEKKPGRKGKRAGGAVDRSIAIPEWTAWENGMLLSTKNPIYFRRLDARILHFLAVETDENDPDYDATVSVGQVCFIIREILGVFESDSADAIFVGDLIKLLPKIFAKLQVIVTQLRTDTNNNPNKHAVGLILRLLQAIFSWKNLAQTGLLQKGLRIVAAQSSQSSSSSLGTLKELIAESYKYFESMIGIATDLPTASGLVELCKTLMKHSPRFTQENRAKQATMAYNFLASTWPEDRHTGASYRTAIVSLLKNWMDHEPNPLHTVSAIMNWLPEEAANLEGSMDTLEQFPTINRSNMHHLIAKIFSGITRGIRSTVGPHQRKFQVWVQVARNTERVMRVCKTMRTRSLLLVYMRMMPMLLRTFLTSGMPILEQYLRYQREDVIGVLKLMQSTTRYLNSMCVESSEKKDMAMTKFVPTVKSILEKLVYSVKSILAANNCFDAFWMGNLVNKDLDGREVYSQNSTVTDDNSVAGANESVNGDVDEDNNDADDVEDDISEAYESDMDEGYSHSINDDDE